MDVSVNPVLESVRPFFQGLPANSGGSGNGSGGPAASPSHPGVATPVQPPPPAVSSPSYWPQRSKAPPTPPHFAQSAKSPALASPLHHVFNGTKLPEEPQRHHNLPPVAALSPSIYQHPRAVRDLASQGALLQRQQQHLPLPSISQITPHSSSPSVSPRTSQSQFRTPDYPQSNHHSIYSPNPSSNQSHRSSSSSSSYQPHLLSSKYQSSPGSPAVSSPSPHAYSYSPRTSMSMATTTTASSPVYPQTTSASSVYVSSTHHHRHLQQPQQTQQNRVPQHPSHHSVSPVIQQPTQPELHGHLKLHHQHPTQHYPPVSSQQPSHVQHSSAHQPPSHPQYSSRIQQSSSHSHVQQQSHIQHSSSSHLHTSSHPPQPQHSSQHSSQPSLQSHQHQIANYQQHKSSSSTPSSQHQQGHNVQPMLHQQSLPSQHHQTHPAQPRSAPQHDRSQPQHHGQSPASSQQQQQQPRGQHHQQSSSQHLLAQQQQHNQQQLLSQQHQQLQQQAAMYNQSIQQNSSRQSDAEKLAEMQQVLRMKQRQLAAVQAQQQAYYAAVSSSNSSRSTSQTTTTTVEASNHQRTTTTQALTGGLKRESPLDLSVKTVRQSADSTAKDDSESAYLASFQSHEAFQQRMKAPAKTASPRNSAVLPPLQLPSTVVYPHFENHSSSQTAGSGAPKVDFLPNFNAHHSPSAGSSANFQDPNKRQRKSSNSQLPSPSQYPPHVGSLPHMGSFKKSSLPSAAYDDPNKQTQYYPATGPPGISRSSAMSNHSLNMQPNFATAPSSQYSYDSSKRGSSARYDLLERRGSSSSLQSSSSVESNYTLGKRSSSSEVRHPLPPKIPRVVDTWRQTIDQQIEQRLNSYVTSRGLQMNGTTKESLNSDPMLHQQTASLYSSASTIQASHGTAHMSSDNSSRSSLIPPQRSNSSSKLNVSSQYYPHSQPQYPAQTVPPRQAQEPYNNLAQVKLPSLPSNGAADKRVLSILRKRLDTREATNQLVQQQSQPPIPARDDRSKMYSSLAPRYFPQPLVVPSPVISSQSKPPPQTPLARHNLPPFNALSLERSATMSYPTQKLHIPRAMDSVAPDHSQGSIPVRTDPVPPRSETTGKPAAGDNGGDFDGLAAFLAARIRTKAELKQVGPSVEQQRTPTPASGSNSSAQSPRTTPGIFSPPPSTQLQYPAVPGDFSKGTPTSESDRASSSGMSGCSPLKSRDRYGINSPRRRLFCRPEDDVGEGVIQARERGLRSSSETSVFDFRESDSDGETGSERQSLTDMRKDRDRRLQERQQTTTVPSPDPVAEDFVGDPEPIDDSFWSGMCDQFVTQLQKGGNKVRKRGKQKKWVYPSLTKSESVETLEQLDEVKSEASSAFVDPEMVSIKEEKDFTESNEVVEDVKVMPDEETFTENLFTPKENLCTLEQILPTPNEDFSIPKVCVKKEEESSDEDAPLSLRQTELKKVKETKSNVECSVSEDKPLVNIPPEFDRLSISLENIKQEDLKTDDLNQGNKESSDSEGESSADDESTTSVAKRLRVRKPKEETESKRKTRSSEKENANTSQKGGRKKKEEKKKSVYGDGSEFRPGWEAEVYRYKRSLRMPARLINIAGPQSWPRLSVSLPDLDPDSPMTLDSDLSLQNKRFESDGESTPTKTKPKDSPKNKLPQKKVEEKGEEDSFINRLIQRYGGKGKKSLRKGQEKDNSKERKGPKIIPQSTELQLLPTPSLDCIVKSPAKKLDLNSPQIKQTKGKKSSKDKQEKEKPIGFDSQEAVYLGYFRKKTVADFRDAFAKHNGGFATEHELPPIMLKSRTRTQTRILTQRATIREVFGDDRPASAPPAGCRDEEIEHNEKPLSEEKKSKKSSTKSKAVLSKRNSTSGMSPVTRSGLRNAAVLRSNKAVLKSKQHLLHGGERRKRSKDLIKAFTSSKKYHQDPLEKQSSIMEAVVKLEPIEATTKAVEEEPVLVSGKRLKYRSVRRKLKSSGFDYIRKKKKQQLKKEGDTESVKERKEKKKIAPLKLNLESEEDIQNEIKCWVINKGLGETVLHRAARLGYTDIAAYCLERMDHNPSPRDNAGYTPLHEACSKGRLDIARLLLLYGADVSDSAQGGIRPLHEAAESGCVELIRLLLSYGADPQLATYSGLTPLALSHHHPEARTLLQNHLADVQGQPSSPWQVLHADPVTLGNDVLADPPSPDPCEGEVEVESGELSLPHLYQLLGEPLTDRWVLFQELGPVLKVKTREALIKQLGQSHRHDFRDLKMTDFYDMARCCSILGVGDYILNPKAHKVTLVKYSDRVQALLNSEKLLVSAR